MSRRNLGWYVPVLLAGGVVLFSLITISDPALKWGVIAGTAVALAQSFASSGALRWAWNRKSFYWVWGGGIFLRLLVLGLTAFVVRQFTPLSLVATLIALIVATMIFLVVESWAFFSKP
jgi:hypothetical protein